jgi:hypothetical protein
VTNNTYALEVPESEVQDIDNEEDWKVAEIKYSFFKKLKAAGFSACNINLSNDESMQGISKKRFKFSVAEQTDRKTTERILP